MNHIGDVYGIARKHPRGKGRMVWMGERFVTPEGKQIDELWSMPIGWKGTTYFRPKEAPAPTEDEVPDED